MRLQNEGNLSDEEAEPVINRGDEVQRAVLAYPVRSLADLVTKIPVFRNELEHASGPKTPGGKEPLDYAAWVGVIRDIERLAPVTAAAHQADQCPAAKLGEMLDKAWALRDEWDERSPFRDPRRTHWFGVLRRSKS